MRFYLKKTSFLAILILVIANFLLGNVAFAKKIKISDEDVGRLKTGLDLIKIFSNIVVSDDKIKTALNLAIKSGEAGTDITYGLVVLSAWNEMDLIDMVVSQRYKQEASKYFEQVIDERTNLVSYWKGVGYDIPRIVSGRITGPMAGLTLNSFSITEKVISILTVIKVIEQEKKYDGLWRYFDERKHGTSHNESWEAAKWEIGWVPDSNLIKSLSRRNPVAIYDNQINQLESQFAALYEKWGPYTTSQGVTQEAKEKFQEEMGQIVSEAVKEQSLVQKESEPSFFDKARAGLADSITSLKQAIEKAKNFVQNAGTDIQSVGGEFFSDIKSLILRASPFGAQVSQFSELPETAKEQQPLATETETEPIPEKIIGHVPKLEQLQEDFDDVSEMIDVLSQEANTFIKISQLVQPKSEGNKETGKTGEIKKTEQSQNPVEKPIEKLVKKLDEQSTEKLRKQSETEQKENTSQLIPVFATGWTSSPAAKPSYPKILISEVQIASQNTEKDDFVELYNPNSEDLDLTDWYLQRKTKSADDFSTYAPKNLFAGKKILANSYFLITNASSSFLSIADITTTHPLTEDNVLVFKNPNGDIVDKLGWGEAQDFETSPAANPPSDKSIGRKWFETASYVDSDNNSADFEIQEPSPKSQNQSPLPSNPNQLPQASFVFSPVAPFVGDSVVFDAASSTDPDGKISFYIWDFGDGNSTTTNFATTTYYFATSGDFLVQLLIQDDQGGTSTATSTLKITPKPKLAESTVISEVQIKDKEFVELYNPSDQPFSLSNKYLSYFSKNDDWSKPQRNWQLPATATVPAKSFYLIGIYGYVETNGNPSADWQVLTKAGSPYASSQMSNQSGAVGIFSCDPSASSTAANCKVDVFSWQAGDPPLVFEGIPFSFEEEIENKSFQRKKDESGFYIDDNNNSVDFKIGNVSPENSKGEKKDVLAPEQVLDFEIDEDNSVNNKVGLTWSAAEDSDTLPEKISYKIYYSKEEIGEDNLEATSTFSTTTSANSIVISGPSYNSTYYFGIKSFDGWQYSDLSEIVSFEIPSALVNSPWSMFQQNFQRNSQSAYSGPNATPTVIWQYSQESDFQNPSYNPYYTSPVIDPEGIIYTSIIGPDSKEGILALNPDGTKKWFERKAIAAPTVFYLALQPDGSVLADDKKTKDREGNIYATENNILKATDENGQLKWQKEIEFPDLKNYSNYSSYSFGLGNPVISPEGKIYLTAAGRIYPSGNNTTYFYLFALSPETGEIIWTHTISEGYRASSLAVSIDGNVYLFYLVYPIYAWQPTLYLRAISSAGEYLWLKDFSSYSSNPQLIIDSQENLYFSLTFNNTVYGFDKQGEQLWQYSLQGVPWNWHNADIGVVLSSDGVLYLSGLGAIVALK